MNEQCFNQATTSFLYVPVTSTPATSTLISGNNKLCSFQIFNGRNTLSVLACNGRPFYRNVTTAEDSLDVQSNFSCDGNLELFYDGSVGEPSGGVSITLNYMENFDQATNTPYMNYSFWQNGIEYEYNTLQSQLGILTWLLLFVSVVYFVVKIFRTI